MTPQDYIGRLQELVGAERYHEAQVLAQAEHARLRPQFSQAERAFLHGLLEVVAAAVEARARQAVTETATGTPSLTRF